MALAIERIRIVDRDQWMAERQQDVTASVVGALFNCHPYTSALRLFMEKRGVALAETNDNSAMRRGRWLEPAVALAVADERPGWKIVPAREYLRAAKLRFGGTPDFYIEGDTRGLGVLQAKTVGPVTFELEWSDGPPQWIVLQTLAEAMLTDAAFGVVGVLKVAAYDMELALHEVPRQGELEAQILEAVASFWADVDAGRPPEADLRKDAELAKVLAPREVKGKTIDLSGRDRKSVV